jgi:hypothetical protein
MVLLWMGGGMAQTETFDPKRYLPFTPGMEAKTFRSTFPAIDTVVDNIKFCQGLENLARIMDRGTLVRSVRTPEVAATNGHGEGHVYWHTGYLLSENTVAAPSIGAVIARVLGPRHADLPAYIDIADPGDGGGSFRSAGFLGREYGPLTIPYARKAMEVIRPRLQPGAFADRYKFYKALVEKSPAAEPASNYQKESMVKAMDNAHRLLNSPAVKAFDLSLEPKEVYAQFNTGEFGLGCLLARRLVEAGARFIEVNARFKVANDWDHHSNGHKEAKRMKALVDRPVAQLILDLEERGLLKRTVVVVASEMGRDVTGSDGTGNAPGAKIMSDNEYGLHGHFLEAQSILLFGGGFKKGFQYGQTSDEAGKKMQVIDKPVSLPNLHATLYRAMGISPTLSFEVERRPFYVTKDGRGKPIIDLLAANG